MKGLVFKENFAFIYMTKDFYSRENILQTMKIYEEFIETSLTELGKYFIIKIRHIDPSHPLQTIVREFANYTLSLEYENPQKNK